MEPEDLDGNGAVEQECPHSTNPPQGAGNTSTPMKCRNSSAESSPPGGRVGAEVRNS